MTHHIRSFLLLLSLGVASLTCGRGGTLRASPGPGGPTDMVAATREAIPSPPEAFGPLYAEISTQLEPFEQDMGAAWDGRRADTRFGAELLVANGNRGESLLLPQTLSAVQQHLDRLEEVGVQGVTVQVSDPLLFPDFPRQPEYLQFFREVAVEVRNRGLRLLMETGPAFVGTSFSSVRFDWSSLRREDYFRMRRDQIVLISREVQPDYLAIGSEPTTETLLTGIPFEPGEYLDFVRETAARVDRPSSLRVGSGSGSWEDPEYVERYAREPLLDFLDIHIYPLTNGYTDYLESATRAAAAARVAGKAVVLGETWLYKATADELRRSLDYQEIYARDIYSFWQPLDIRYIQAIYEWARRGEVEYASLFWSGFFFAYLDYDEDIARLSFAEQMRRLNERQAAAIQQDLLSATGQAYQALLRGED